LLLGQVTGGENEEDSDCTGGSRGRCARLPAANADDARIGVGVGPVGAGVTVGDSHDHDRTTIIKKEEEPRERTTIIRKEHEDPPDRVIVKEHDRD